MKVTETFFSLEVADMARATKFYQEALGADVAYATSFWTSLYVARVRVGLFANLEHEGGRTGLHFAVSDLEEALTEITKAGGRVVSSPTSPAPGVITADAADTEGNIFTLRGS